MTACFWSWVLIDVSRDWLRPEIFQEFQATFAFKKTGAAGTLSMTLHFIVVVFTLFIVVVFTSFIAVVFTSFILVVSAANIKPLRRVKLCKCRPQRREPTEVLVHLDWDTNTESQRTIRSSGPPGLGH